MRIDSPARRGRASVYGHALSAAEVAQLAADKSKQAGPPSKDRMTIGEGNVADIPSEKCDFSRGLTLEAWIQPDRVAPGRIFDKMTAGGTDGFLFDTHPGDTLRLIVGDMTLSAPAGIAQGRAHGITPPRRPIPPTGELRIYLDGKLVAERPGDTGSPITRGYTLQRYVQACGGRGVIPDQVQRQHLHRRAEAHGQALQRRLARLGRLPLVAERPASVSPDACRRRLRDDGPAVPTCTHRSVRCARPGRRSTTASAAAISPRR